MTVRPIDWRDLPALHRYRRKSVYLHSALVLTRGERVFSGALLSYLAPASGIATLRVNGGDSGKSSKQPIIGQMIHNAGSEFAHLTFFAPEDALESSALPALIDTLAIKAGARGAYHLLADVDEQSVLYEILRRAGFAIYSRQRIWRLAGDTSQDDWQPDGTWQEATGEDGFAIRSLYNNLVPGLVQQVEPVAAQLPNGLVCHQDGELRAYVELKSGSHGIWIHPFIHPDLEEVGRLFASLLQTLPNRRSLPIYICVRSYQSWLEPAIEDLGAAPGPRQAVMVKHMAIAKKATRAFALPALDAGHAEVTAHIARVEQKEK